MSEFINDANSMLPNPHIGVVEEGEGFRLTQSYIENLSSEFVWPPNPIDEAALPLTALYNKLVETTSNYVIDQKTGLLSRAGLNYWFNRYKPRTSLIFMLDARRFKDVNDVYGHIRGDLVLEHLAGQIRSKVRTSPRNNSNLQGSRKLDALSHGVCRWGGDEFICVIDVSDVDEININDVHKKIDERFNSLSNYTSNETGDIPISVRRVSLVATMNDGLSLEDYEETLSALLKENRDAEYYSDYSI